MSKVKLSSLLFIGAMALLFCGCENTFTRFRVTNYHDEMVSEWISRGFVMPLERGYRITAIERISGPPYSIISHYPDGWPTVVTGPHVQHWRCPKPEWLSEYEGDVPPGTPVPRKKHHTAGH